MIASRISTGLPIIQRIKDWLLERRIRKAMAALVQAPKDEQRARYHQLVALWMKRSLAQLERMETELNDRIRRSAR